jgi:hypothetical protein
VVKKSKIKILKFKKLRSSRVFSIFTHTHFSVLSFLGLDLDVLRIENRIDN